MIAASISKKQLPSRCPRAPGEDLCLICSEMDGVESCPQEDLKRTPQIFLFLEAYDFFKSHNQLPSAGGMYDQAAPFIQGVRKMDSEIREIEEKIGKKRASAHGNRNP